MKRIHAVANIGTALKFLEGRKVREKQKQNTKEEGMGILMFSVLTVDQNTACSLYSIDKQYHCIVKYS